MKKTIALLVPRLYNGGAEKVAADMSFFLNKAGYRVVFFLDEFHEHRCYRHSGEVEVIKADSYWNNGCLANQWYHYIRRAKKYKEYKKKYEVDISISFMLEDNLTNVLADIGDRKILTVHCVTSQMREFEGQLFANWKIMRFMYPKADAVVAVSKYVKRDLEGAVGIRRCPVQVIYNSVNDAYLIAAGKEPVEEELSDNLILYVGRLDDEKRPWIVVRAMKAVVEQFPDAQLLIFGEGSNRMLLKKLIRKLKLENNIRLGGFEKNVAKYMTRAKILVICSRTEAFPCVIEEAFTLALPVIFNDCPGGMREMASIEGAVKGECKENKQVECGIITPMIYIEKKNCDRMELSREERSFAQAICDVLENTQMRDQLRKNALKRSRRFFQSRIEQEWLDLLENGPACNASHKRI